MANSMSDYGAAAIQSFLTVKVITWIFLGIFSLIRFQAHYLLVGVYLTLGIANIVGFTRCPKVNHD